MSSIEKEIQIVNGEKREIVRVNGQEVATGTELPAEFADFGENFLRDGGRILWWMVFLFGLAMIPVQIAASWNSIQKQDYLSVILAVLSVAYFFKLGIDLRRDIRVKIQDLSYQLSESRNQLLGKFAIAGVLFFANFGLTIINGDVAGFPQSTYSFLSLVLLIFRVAFDFFFSKKLTAD